MTAAQELFELLKNAKPSPNMERKPLPAPVKHAPVTRLFKPLPPKRVELPALGGCCEILYDYPNDGGQR